MQKENPPEEGNQHAEKSDIGNISEKEFKRDMVNLYLPPIELVNDDLDFNTSKDRLIAKYGQEYWDELMADVTKTIEK